MSLKQTRYGKAHVDAHESVRRKAFEVFSEAFGSRADVFTPGVPARHAHDVLAAALAEDYVPAVADEIAFHLVDWEVDAAFLVAFMLFPERFTAEELQAGADMLLIHAPAHLMAAARLADLEPRDIFIKGADAI
jgi:hypothetical protein